MPSSIETLPMLVDPELLSQQFADDKLVILDSTVIVYTRDDGRKDSRPGLEEYLSEHIPGARFTDLLNNFSVKRKNARFGIPTATAFSQAAAALGISNDTQLVIYSSSDPLWATRLWWLFKFFGHEKVSVLDGGLSAWKANGHHTETGTMDVVPGQFRARVQTERLALKTDVLRAITAPHPPSKVIDVLSPEYFAGRAGNLYGYKRLGHIQTAINIPAATVLSETDHTFLPIENLQQLAHSLSQAEDQRIITYCDGGIAATQMAFALEYAGHKNVQVYSGSLHEWSADPDMPMATGTN